MQVCLFRAMLFHDDHKIRPVSQVILKLAQIFYRDRSLTDNNVLRSIKPCSIINYVGKKRPLLILYRDDGFASLFRP